MENKNSTKHPSAYKIISIVVIVILAILFTFPLYWIITGSFKTNAAINSTTPIWWPKEWTLANYQKLFSRQTAPLFQFNIPFSSLITGSRDLKLTLTGPTVPAAVRWLINTVFMAIMSMILTCITASMAGYALAKKRFVGRQLLFTLIVCAMALPKQVILIPLLREMSSLNLYNTIWAVIFPIVGWPFGVFLMKQFSEGVPSEMLEAAQIDGASEAKTFLQIVVPMIKPGIGALAIFTFINKMDRDANDTFDLLDEIEKELGIATCPINWPIGSGKNFKGVYDRNTREIMTFSDTLKGTKEGTEKHISVDDPALIAEIGQDAYDKLMEEIELLDGASAEFDQELVTKGELSPVFFGSALTNFGVETFLQHFLKMTYSPLPRKADIGEVDPFGEDFSAFVFKIQANMNKAHRDRIAFMRICSGKFTAGMEVTHVQGGNKKIKLSQPQQMMAQERHIVDEAYAGDIIGVFDPGIFSIGDTLTTAKPFKFEGIPTFAPEHFARVRQVDTMKRKQFMKGMQQIAQEGAIQIFQEYNMGMEEVIVGVVGVLQFDVLKYRLENEYNVEIRMDTLPYEHIRWIENEDIDMDKLVGTSDMKKIQDLKGRPLLLFVNAWSVGMVLDRNEGLVLSEFGRE